MLLVEDVEVLVVVVEVIEGYAHFFVQGDGMRIEDCPLPHAPVAPRQPMPAVTSPTSSPSVLPKGSTSGARTSRSSQTRR